MTEGRENKQPYNEIIYIFLFKLPKENSHI